MIGAYLSVGSSFQVFQRGGQADLGRLAENRSSEFLQIIRLLIENRRLKLTDL